MKIETELADTATTYTTEFIPDKMGRDKAIFQFPATNYDPGAGTLDSVDIEGSLDGVTWNSLSVNASPTFDITIEDIWIYPVMRVVWTSGGTPDAGTGVMFAYYG